MINIFESLIRSTGDIAGVFEFDGETSYFYLYDVNEADGKKVLDAINITSGIPDFEASDISIRWNDEENLVSLRIKDDIWAAFDCESKSKYGGNYFPGARPKLPPDVLRRLQ